MITSYDTIIKHTTDAEFRAWGLAIKTALAAVGLTQTADSGQIDWASVTIPGSTTKAGYEIWRFNDAAQGAAPIFLKLKYGTASATDAPALSVQVGISSDGSGNLNGSGALSTEREVFGDSAPFSTVTPYGSYFCYNTDLGALTMAWKLGGQAGVTQPGYGFFAVGRSCDSAGAPTTDGATFYSYGAGSTIIAQALDFTNDVAYTEHQNHNIVVGNVLSSMVGINVQAYLHWTHYPRVEPINWLCTIIEDEISRQTFTTSLVGVTDHTYLSLGINSPPASPGSNQAHYAIGMLYE